MGKVSITILVNSKKEISVCRQDYSLSAALLSWPDAAATWGPFSYLWVSVIDSSQSLQSPSFQKLTISPIISHANHLSDFKIKGQQKLEEVSSHKIIDPSDPLETAGEFVWKLSSLFSKNLSKHAIWCFKTWEMDIWSGFWVLCCNLVSTHLMLIYRYGKVWNAFLWPFKKRHFSSLGPTLVGYDYCSMQSSNRYFTARNVKCETFRL